MTAVRRTLAALGIGLVVQRVAQLTALLLLARTLGPEATGRSAQGLAVAGMLAIAGGAGLRNEVARGIARSPTAMGNWLRAAIRARLLRSCWLMAVASAVALACSAQPSFWLVSIAGCLPAAFDLKQLGDVAARTRREVAIEAGSALVCLAATAVWLWSGGADLTALAAIQCACRMGYAAASWRTVRALPQAGAVPSARELLRRSRRLAPAQVLGELTVALDVLLVGLLGGDAVSGHYAIASRIAGAAGMPTAQLTRLFFAHQMHAAARGDSARATRVALRATALVLLPLLGGGIAAAAPLCSLFGPQFGAAEDALRWLLVAVAAQHLGWQAHQALLARGEDRAFAQALLAPSLAHAAMLIALTPPFGSVGAACATATAQVLFLGAALRGQERRAVLPLTWARGPLALAAATFAVTWFVGCAPLAHRLWWQLLAGGTCWSLGIYALELRRRWHRLGSGLVEASGFRH